VQLGLDHETVADAISGLRACHLLDEGPTAATMTRRGLTMRAVKIGGAAVAAPLIVSIAAPAAAMAVTESFCAKISVATGHGCGDCHQYGCCCCEPKGAGQTSPSTLTVSSSTKPCHADCHTHPACNVGVQANCNGNTANCQH
jgi:hypothetical protein